MQKITEYIKENRKLISILVKLQFKRSDYLNGTYTW